MTYQEPPPLLLDADLVRRGVGVDGNLAALLFDLTSSGACLLPQLVGFSSCGGGLGDGDLRGISGRVEFGDGDGDGKSESLKSIVLSLSLSLF